jgi:hypothetical protein
MRVNESTTLTTAAMKRSSGGEGEAVAALGSTEEGDGMHGTMVEGGDSSEGEVSSLVRVRENEGSMGRGGLVERIQPPRTMENSREAHLCSGESLAELRGLGD